MDSLLLAILYLREVVYSILLSIMYRYKYVRIRRYFIHVFYKAFMAIILPSLLFQLENGRLCGDDDEVRNKMTNIITIDTLFATIKISQESSRE